MSTEQHDHQQHRRQREEEEESPSLASPSKRARHHSSDSTAGAVTMVVSSPLKLVLGLGIGDTTATTVNPPPHVLTFMQMKELQHQALIYKYMSAGVPVPLNLVLPIWKTVAASASAALHRFPTLMERGMNDSIEMEPEPGRCRRTDGKKWRCSRDIVPDHKYCDRHVHRGRSHSRKLVAPAAAAAAAAATVVQPNNGINLSISVPNVVGGFRKYTNSSGNASPIRVVGFSPSSVLQGGEAAADGKAR